MSARILERARFGRRDKIVAIEPVGEGSVISMQTTTGNYVAWGYASKNCDTELVTAAKQRNQWAFAADSHVTHLHPFYDKTVPTDSTYQQGMSTSKADRAIYQQRLRRSQRR